MTTRHNMGLVSAPFFADEDLADKQYYCVRAASTKGYVSLANGASEQVPLGILQGNSGSTRGETVEVGLFGTMTAKVAACDDAGNVCPIAIGYSLMCSSSGTLFRSGSLEVANAMALEDLSTGCAVANIEVFFYGPILGASSVTTC